MYLSLRLNCQAAGKKNLKQFEGKCEAGEDNLCEMPQEDIEHGKGFISQGWNPIELYCNELGERILFPGGGFVG